MSGHIEAVTRAMITQAEEDSIRVFIAGINNTFIQSTLYGNAPHDLEHAYTIARTIEHDNRHQNLRLSPEGKFTKTFGNEQRHQHQQRYQPQPRTELRPRPPLNNFQPRTQQYQSPRYNNHQPPPEPMDTSSGNTAYRQPTSPNPFYHQPWKRGREPSGNYRNNKQMRNNNIITREDDNSSTIVETVDRRKETSNINYTIGNDMYRERIDKLMKENNGIGPLPFTTTVEATIRTKTDEPIWTKQYPYPIADNDFVNREIDRLIKDGIIQRSNSPYNSPIWTVPKKGLDEDGRPKKRMAKTGINHIIKRSSETVILKLAIDLG
ncbi:Retrovirus-related Pol polyprotein from transposon gypsy [Eumeta japonica]|uniref:Retrovirus-related Pol polyprotein from transposon gypsy n=1 Tax=Eumeta variegata TaxID=151549 RepID=A0A4C1SDM4_EUMVA|nr:Retrovirus-related Pol polyprotein from transposon gypsy [Eumeta japonica]